MRDMNMRRLGLMGFMILIAALAGSPAGAEIYQWVDREGLTHASSDPEAVPPAYRGGVQIISVTGKAREMVEEYVIPFEKGPSGVIIVRLLINDVLQARMVFDTGATLVLISDELARRMDQSGSVASGEKIRLRTAGGDVEGRAISIGKLDLGNAVRENVRAAVSPRKQPFDDFDGLLGLSFLEGFKVVIDHSRQEIILRKS
jgi:clan AA aspartic protease (TIGR02281 family)